jgi:hypothetical protein
MRQLARAQPRPSEGRGAKRLRFVQFLWFQRLDETSGVLGRSVDVSEEGIGFVASRDVPRNERVFLVMLTPWGRISAIASVVHSSPVGKGSYRIGVRLEIVPPTERAIWTTLVSKEDP